MAIKRNNAPKPGAPIDVILLTGFLGAGKTTLLKRILSWETDLSDTVVVVNEFGDVGIDGALLKSSGSDVVEMKSGCICCSLSADLKVSLERIRNAFQPRRILIESSGVADPTAISSVLSEPALSQHMSLEKIIAVLDASFWEGRDVFGPLFFNQLEMGHLLLLNKIDLIDADEVPTYLKEIHDTIPNAQVIPTVQCRVDPETLWADSKPKGIDLKPMDFYHTKSDRESVAATRFETFSFQSSRPLDEARFKQFVEELPFELFRMKGPVRFVDRTAMVNFVGGRGEWTPWEEDTDTQLAFIGWGVNSEKTLHQLKKCEV